jgi:hypothetical protein
MRRDILQTRGLGLGRFPQVIDHIKNRLGGTFLAAARD